MKKAIMFRSKTTGRLVCVSAPNQSVDFIALKGGGSLKPMSRGVKGSWRLTSPTKETTIHVTMPNRRPNPNPTSPKDAMFPRPSRVAHVHSAVSKERKGGSENGGDGFLPAAKSLTRIADKLKMPLTADPSWFGSDLPKVKLTGPDGKRFKNPDGKWATRTAKDDNEATGLLRKTYTSALGFKDDPVRRSSMIAAAKAKGSRGEHLAAIKESLSGNFHPLRREPR